MLFINNIYLIVNNEICLTNMQKLFKSKKTLLKLYFLAFALILDIVDQKTQNSILIDILNLRLMKQTKVKYCKFYVKSFFFFVTNRSMLFINKKLILNLICLNQTRIDIYFEIFISTKYLFYFVLDFNLFNFHFSFSFFFYYYCYVCNIHNVDSNRFLIILIFNLIV